MIRGIEFYILVWILVTFGIVGFRHLTGKEKWALTKAIAFGAFAFSLLSVTAFAEATFQQVETFIEQQQYEVASLALKEIIANHPNSAKAYYAMSQAQAGLGNLEKAQFALNKAKSIDPELKFATSSNIASLEQAITPQTSERHTKKIKD